MTKTKAFTGLSKRIRKAPIKQAMKAPTIGRRAENITTTPIITAYGILIIDNSTINIIPSIIASRHWPVMKEEKLLWRTSKKWWILLPAFSDTYALSKVFSCLPNLSFSPKRYMEKIRETKKEATELTTWPATLKVDERKAPRPFFREGRTLPTKVSKLSSKIPEYSWLSLKNEKTYLWRKALSLPKATGASFIMLSKAEINSGITVINKRKIRKNTNRRDSIIENTLFSFSPFPFIKKSSLFSMKDMGRFKT